MDFRDSPEEAAFRDRLRDWLAEQGGAFATSGDDYWARQGEWHQALYSAGFFGLSWPQEFGGQELPPVYDVIVDEELARAGAPPRPSLGYLVVGPGPARQRGTATAVPARDDQRHRALVPGLLRAGRGLRSGVAAHEGDPRRRQLRHRTATRSGPATPTSPTGVCCWPGPTRTHRGTRGSRRSSSPCTSPGIEQRPLRMINGVTTEFGQVRVRRRGRSGRPDGRRAGRGLGAGDDGGQP